MEEATTAADILAERIFGMNIANHAFYKDDPVKRAEFEESTGMDFDMQLVHPSEWGEGRGAVRSDPRRL
ncbi:hypothetical protein [Allosphingosinicella humi]